MFFIGRRIKAVLYDVNFEVIKGALKGQLIRITNPRRYMELKMIRPERKRIIEQKKELLGRINDLLINHEIKSIKVYARIKTIGGFDRKERYARKRYPDSAKAYACEDFLAFTVVVASNVECYKVLNVIREFGTFPRFDYRANPRDYMKDVAKVRRPEVTEKHGGITGNIAIRGIFFPIHFRILTKEDLLNIDSKRGEYKRNIWKIIKEK